MKHWLQKFGVSILLIASLLASLVMSFTAYQPQTLPPIANQQLVVKPQYSIITTTETLIWPANSVLEQGYRSYSFNTDPLIIIQPQVQFLGTNDFKVSGMITHTLVLQSIADQDQLFWQTTLEELETVAFDLSANQSLDLNEVMIAPTQLNEMIAEINRELALNAGTVQLLVQTDISYSASNQTTSYSGNATNRLPITFNNFGFEIATVQDSTSRINVTPAIPVNQPTLTSQVIADPLPATLNVGILLLTIFYLLMINKQKSESKRAHRKFKEWITDGSVSTKDKVNISVYSLEGLVDLAIDLDKRVIYDADKEKYYVLEDTIVYTHDPFVRTQVNKGKKQLGKLFVERGLITDEQLEIGLLYQQKSQRPIGTSLLELGFIDEISLFSTLAFQSNIRFLPLDPDQLVIDQNLIQQLGVLKAKLLEIVPIGLKADTTVVIACASPNTKGLKETCLEIFKKDVELVATQPSSIYKLLEKVDQKQPITKNQVSATPVLEPEEINRFKTSYQKGKFELDLFLRATGLVGTTILATVPTNEPTLLYLVNNNYLLAEYAHLINAIGLAYQKTTTQVKENGQLPPIEEIYLKANYLVQADYQWILEEMNRKGLSLETIMINNSILLPSTVTYTQSLCKCLSLLLS